MSTRLHLNITSTRRHNLPRIIYHYLSEMEPHPFELRIHVLVQGPDPDPYGLGKQNEAINMIPDGWVFMFADDTMQYPALFRRLGEIIAEHPTAGCVLFAQGWNDHVLQASPANSAKGHLCGGAMAWNREFIGDVRFDNAWPSHNADVRFFARLYSKDPSRFVHVNEVLTKHNSMEWEVASPMACVNLGTLL